MTRNKSENTSGTGLQQISEEIRALTEVVQQLADQLHELQLTAVADKEKETSSRVEKKEEGIFKAGDPVILKSKSKYGKRGDKGQVVHIGKVFITVRLKTGRTTTRQPQNLEHDHE